MGFATFRAYCADKAPTQHQCVTSVVAKPVAAFQRGRTDEKPIREPRNAALSGAIRTRSRERNNTFWHRHDRHAPSSAVRSRRSVPGIAAATRTRVTVRSQRSTSFRPLALRLDLINHSPSGFEVGLWRLRPRAIGVGDPCQCAVIQVSPKLAQAYETGKPIALRALARGQSGLFRGKSNSKPIIRRQSL